MSENFGVEEFEKVDAIQADQDESVTSTSLTGEMAEEDRYEPSAPPTNDADLLADFMSGGPPNDVTETVPEEPLLTFETPVPSAPVVTEYVSPVKPSQPMSMPTEETCSKGNTNHSVI